MGITVDLNLNLRGQIIKDEKVKKHHMWQGRRYSRQISGERGREGLDKNRYNEKRRTTKALTITCMILLKRLLQ